MTELLSCIQVTDACKVGTTKKRENNIKIPSNKILVKMPWAYTTNI